MLFFFLMFKEEGFNSEPQGSIFCKVLAHSALFLGQKHAVGMEKAQVIALEECGLRQEQNKLSVQLPLFSSTESLK